MNNIFQIKTSDSRREFNGELQNLIIAHSEKIYKLKREIRKRDLFMSEFERKVNFALRMISEFKDRSEGKFEDEINKSKNLKEI
jgi:hypothetical protein